MLIGHAGHEEVEGTSGQAPERTVLVQDLDGRADGRAPGRRSRLPDPDHPVGRRDERDRGGAAARGIPHLQGPPREDICYATQNRQDAVKALVAAGRRAARDRLEELLELQPPGRGRARTREAGLPRRRRDRGRPGVARRRVRRRPHERRQRAGAPGRRACWSGSPPAGSTTWSRSRSPRRACGSAFRPVCESCPRAADGGQGSARRTDRALRPAPRRRSPRACSSALGRGGVDLLPMSPLVSATLATPATPPSTSPPATPAAERLGDAGGGPGRGLDVDVARVRHDRRWLR